MGLSANENYQRIAKVIEYLQNHFDSQPDLEKLAEIAHLSPFHFQRMFTDWAGTSPKKFLQYISLQYAKSILKQKDTTLADAAFHTGLSGTGRLHDLFVQFEGMTPGEYKNGGSELAIDYSFSASPFGKIIVASTGKGICYMAFIRNETETLHELMQHFPKAKICERQVEFHNQALGIFRCDWNNLPGIKLHLKGTPFQLKVWEALLKIPFGQLSTYGTLAEKIGSPNASRAVGTAIGSNPVAFIIPCHRVIQASGLVGGYRWGPARKRAIIGWEASRIHPEN